MPIVGATFLRRARLPQLVEVRTNQVTSIRPVSQCPITSQYSRNMQTPPPSASQLISAKLAELGDWRGQALSRIRQLIHEAVPEVLEEWKWNGTPVWSHNGILCTGESYKKVVKLTFAKGASLPDPTRIFNSSLDGKVRRAIDIPEGVQIDESAFQALIRAAVARNQSARF